MKFELKSIGYWSAIRVSFIVNLLLGLIIGFFFAIFSGLMMSLMSSVYGSIGISIPELESPPILLLIILYPLMFGFGGAVCNTIIAVIGVFIYNLVGKFIGGLELELSEMVLQPVAPVQRPAYVPPPPPPVQPLPRDMMPPDQKTKEDKPPSGDDYSL